MKASFKSFHVMVCLFLAVSWLAAEDSVAPLGYLRIVNGIAPGSGNVRVRVDGQEIYPKGYRFGAVTGGIGLAPGVHKAEIQREGVVDGSVDVTVVRNLTVTLLAYAEEIPAINEKPARHQARLMALAPREVEKGKLATFVSLSRTPLLQIDVRGPDGKWHTEEVPRLRPVECPILLVRGYVALKSGGKSLDAIPVAEPGNYVVVLFDDTRGRLCSVSFRDSGEIAGD